MNYSMEKYPVQNPILKRYIKFFWGIRADAMSLNHKIIPVRNIDLKFNLSDTPHYQVFPGNVQTLENIYFSGFQDQFNDVRIRINGKVDVMGICFHPDGQFPFIRIPGAEFKNRIVGASDAGIFMNNSLIDQLRETRDVQTRIAILEKELVSKLDSSIAMPEKFRLIFNSLNQEDNFFNISGFCKDQNISIRKLERMYQKYIGISAKSYGILNRFQNSINQLFFRDYSRLSDIAYENGYFDQMHFIKEFKRFTGNSPKGFVEKEDSMLHIGKPM